MTSNTYTGNGTGKGEHKLLPIEIDVLRKDIELGHKPYDHEAKLTYGNKTAEQFNQMRDIQTYRWY